MSSRSKRILEMCNIENEPKRYAKENAIIPDLLPEQNSMLDLNIIDMPIYFINDSFLDDLGTVTLHSEQPMTDLQPADITMTDIGPKQDSETIIEDISNNYANAFTSFNSPKPCTNEKYEINNTKGNDDESANTEEAENENSQKSHHGLKNGDSDYNAIEEDNQVELAHSNQYSEYSDNEDNNDDLLEHQNKTPELG